jgi:outer membrane receptor protein involved in Fe transport
VGFAAFRHARRPNGSKARCAAGSGATPTDNREQRAPQDLVNLRLSAQRKAWTVTAFLENAFDERYVLGLLPQQWSGVPAGNIAKAARGRH